MYNYARFSNYRRLYSSNRSLDEVVEKIYIYAVNEVRKARKNVPFSPGVSPGAGHGS